MNYGLQSIRYGNYSCDACMGHVCSLDAPVRGKEGEEDSTLGDLAASACDLEGETVDRMDYENLCSVLWECVDSLPGNSRL